jgi:hypothetical protein
VIRQLSLLASVERQERPHKRVRQTSIAQYAHLRDTRTLAKRRASVLKAVAALKNRTGVWPTSCEVQQWLVWQREIPADGNPNHVRPRLHELAEMGVIERGPKRPSRSSGLTVLTWQVREVGGKGRS